MINTHSKVMLILKDQSEVTLFSESLKKSGFEDISAFTNSQEAHDEALKTQHQLFIIRHEVEPLNGPICFQKIHTCGNYGQETILFVADKIDQALLTFLTEFELPHVLIGSVSQGQIEEKIKQIIDTESNLSEFEKTYRQARSALDNGIIEMAEMMAQKLYGDNPQSEKSYIVLGDVERAKKDYSAARKHYEKAIEINPKCSSASYRLAQTFMAENNFAVAAKMMDKLAENNPYNIELLTNAGISNVGIENYKKAEEYGEKLKSLDKESKGASQIKANINIKKGDFSSLAQDLKKTHSKKEFISFINNAGVKLSKDNDVAGALKMYMQVIEEVKDSEFAYAIYYNIALAHKKLNEIKEAKFYYEKTLEIKPDFAKAKAALKALQKAA